MKTLIAAACIAFAAMFAANASAELYKCVKDGKTTYQEQPCRGHGGAETKIQTSKPSSWVGCYHSEGPTFDGGGVRQETIEIRQDGSTLYSTDGSKDGPYEVRLLWAPASAKQLSLMKEYVAGKEKAEIEVTSGLVMAGAATGPFVNKGREDEILGYWWIRGFDIEGDPMHHLPRTKETLRTSKEMLYIFAPFTFEKVTKVPCAVKK